MTMLLLCQYVVRSHHFTYQCWSTRELVSRAGIGHGATQEWLPEAKETRKLKCCRVLPPALADPMTQTLLASLCRVLLSLHFGSFFDARNLPQFECRKARLVNLICIKAPNKYERLGSEKV